MNLNNEYIYFPHFWQSTSYISSPMQTCLHQPAQTIGWSKPNKTYNPIHLYTYLEKIVYYKCKLHKQLK